MQNEKMDQNIVENRDQNIADNTEEERNSKLGQIMNWVQNNTDTLKLALVIYLMIMIMWVYQRNLKCPRVNQSGGSKFIQAYKASIAKGKSGLSKAGNISPISSAFSVVTSIVSSIFMILGIVLILILVPTIPIMIFLTISYYIMRQKLWVLRTM